METVLSLCAGLGLSAACGFRVFVPLLIMSIAAHAGHLALGAGFQWIGTDAALVAFAVATLLEVTAYYVPWLDNLLDAVATPCAVVAGAVVMASFATDLSPFLRWTLAMVAGGGAAGVVQAVTVVTRGASSLHSGGLANPFFATAELAASAVSSALVLSAPVLAPICLVMLGMALLAAWMVRKRRMERA